MTANPDRPYYDDLETRPAEAREGSLMARLPGLVEHAIANAPGWQQRLAGVDPREIASRRALAQLPVLRKSELLELQQTDPPFGGLTTVPVGDMSRLFMSPGPILEPQAAGPDPWRTARALWATGVRPGQILANCFGYHLTPGGWMIDAAAQAIGCAVIPAGTGQTEQQLELLRRFRPDAYVGTPSFLRILIERAQESGTELTVKSALLGAEALPGSLRQWFFDQGLTRVLQSYGTADVGTIAYESTAMEGMILDEDLILEIVRPGTGEPLPDGEVGEVVVTSFNRAYPLIRFGTGDLSAVMAGPSPCGRTNVRIKGWLGRADQTAKVRGMFVHPGQVAEIARRHPQVRRARLVISGEMANDQMTLCVEVDGADASLSEALTTTIRDVTKLRGDVRIAAPGSLPNDGKLIEDARRLD